MCKLPGPGPVLAAPLRPRCVPAAGGSSAAVTDRSEPPAPSLCPAVQQEHAESIRQLL